VKTSNLASVSLRNIKFTRRWKIQVEVLFVTWCS